jgi:hypothetical protein
MRDHYSWGPIARQVARPNLVAVKKGERHVASIHISRRFPDWAPSRDLTISSSQAIYPRAAIPTSTYSKENDYDDGLGCINDYGRDTS